MQYKTSQNQPWLFTSWCVRDFFSALTFGILTNNSGDCEKQYVNHNNTYTFTVPQTRVEATGFILFPFSWSGWKCDCQPCAPSAVLEDTWRNRKWPFGVFCGYIFAAIRTWCKDCWGIWQLIFDVNIEGNVFTKVIDLCSS